MILEAGAEPVVKHLGQNLILDETIQELYKTAKSKRYSESLRLFQNKMKKEKNAIRQTKRNEKRAEAAAKKAEEEKEAKEKAK